MNRHAVVTGAAEGIGRALVEVLGTHNYALTGVDVNAVRAAQTQAELSARGLPLNFIHADLGRLEDLNRLASVLIGGPPIDVLVNNAGISCVGAFARSDLARQQMVLDVNLRAPLHLTTALLHAGKIARGGTLVFISSLSHYTSYPGAAVYAAGKDALASYGRSLAVALAPQEIHVLVVYPGPTRTAHASRYSPDNRREARRMAPETLAASIHRAIERRQHRLIPGWGNRVTALLGQWLPAPVEWVMKQSLFAKLQKASRSGQ
jgi:short-subunit dehydrogenase